jgi:tetratricopeptide (TPR) repeat protein
MSRAAFVGVLVVGIGALATLCARCRVEPEPCAVTARAPAPAPALDTPPPSAPAEPTTASDWIARSRTLSSQCEYREAERAATRSIELDPSYAYAVAERAWVRAMLGDREGSFADATRATELSSGYAFAWRTRGWARPQGDTAGTIADETRAIELDPKDASAWRLRAWALERTGSLDRALEDAVKATEVAPGDATTWDLRARIEAARGDLAAASRDADKALELDPSDASTCQLAANLRGETLDPASRVAALSSTVASTPGKVVAWRALAWAKAEVGDFEGAIAAASRTLELDAHDGSALRCRSWARSETGDTAGAATDAERARAMDPGRPVLSRLQLPADLALEAAESPEAARRASEQAEHAVSEARAEGTVAAAARALETCYRLGRREASLGLLAGAVRAFDDPGSPATVACGFVSVPSGGVVEVTVERRAGVEGPIAIALPPGTVAESPERPDSDPEVRPERWPRPQDLALLRAPVVVLEAGVARQSVRVPIACASFSRSTPREGLRYTLRRFESGSLIDRLLRVLCSGDVPPEGAASQLAVWIARNAIGWRTFAARTGGEWRAFSGEESTADSVAEAARLLARASIEPRTTPFFESAPVPADDAQ